MGFWFKVSFWAVIAFVASLAVAITIAYLTDFAIAIGQAFGGDTRGLETILMSTIIVLAAFLIAVAYINITRRP